MTVAVVDYGVGNIKSICAAITAVGHTPKVTCSRSEILNSNSLVLPGVGAFAHGMTKLQELDLVHVIRDFSASGRPLLGICLGMQLLFQSSSEFGLHSGLGLIEGTVNKIDGGDLPNFKLPHIGWCPLSAAAMPWENSILKSTRPEDFFYFIHSFGANTQPNTLLATTEYRGVQICAAVQQENIFGCQFHPEKSGLAGLNILGQFLSAR